MTYRLVILPAAERYCKKIREELLKEAFRKAIDEILANPYIGDAKVGDLSGVYCYDVYYNKINYELAYTIVTDADTTIVIILAGTRENIYEQLKRYMR